MDGSTMEERSALSGLAAVEIPHRMMLSAAEDCARFSFRIGPEGREAAARALGLPLPRRIGGMASRDNRTALCLGPDEWSLLVPETEGEAVRRDLASLDVPHSLVDCSHRDVGIELRGASAEFALGAVCALDLSAMPAGSVTRTILDRAPVVLVKHAPDHYRIDVWQSFAGHVWGLLEAVSHEIALDL